MAFVQTKYDELCKQFNNAVKKVAIYNTDANRKLPDDDVKLNKYATDILNAYNNFVRYAAEVYPSMNAASKRQIDEKFSNNYSKSVVDWIDFLGFSVEPPVSLNECNIDSLISKSPEGAKGQTNNVSEDENESNGENEDNDAVNGSMKTVNENADRGEMNQKSPSKLDKKKESLFTLREPNEFDELYSLDFARRMPEPTKRAKKQTNERFHSNYVQRRSENSNMLRTGNLRGRGGGFRPPNRSNLIISSGEEDDDNFDDVQNGDLISKLDFYNLCARTFTEVYSGDPLGLRPFLNQIKMVQGMCKTREHIDLLQNFIMSHVRGVALDLLPEQPESIEQMYQFWRRKLGRIIRK